MAANTTKIQARDIEAGDTVIIKGQTYTVEGNIRHTKDRNGRNWTAFTYGATDINVSGYNKEIRSHQIIQRTN